MGNKEKQQRFELKVYRKRKTWRRWKKRQNFTKNLKKKGKKRKIKSRNRLIRKTKTLQVPQDFSLATNTEGVLNFAESCRKIVQEKISFLIIDFSNVIQITHGSMALLLSIIHYLSYYNTIVTGNLPTDENSKQIFLDCGFLEFFKKNFPLTKKTKSTIMVHGEERIDQARTAPEVAKAMETVFGAQKRNQRLQGMIIEMMTNAVNHAYKAKNDYKKWYLSVFHLEDEKKVKFCFIDNGQGIIKTIHLKYFGIRKAIAPETTLKKAFDGEYGSRTKLWERGTGLIAIKKCFTLHSIKNLKVITGNLFYDFDNNNVTELNSSFEGTFYFWELDSTCKNVSIKN